MQVDVLNKEGQTAGTIELNDAIFGIEPNEHALHQAIVAYLANKRQGTHSTKTRSDVRGGGRKPWRQKGRGTARAGTIRSPLWAGGGIIHGPKPHKYTWKLPKKVKRLARKSAFSLRLSEENLIVAESFNLDSFKTKEVANALKNMNLDGMKTLILIPANDEKLYFSARNIPGVTVMQAGLASTYDILNHRKVVIIKEAIEVIEKTFNTNKIAV